MVTGDSVVEGNTWLCKLVVCFHGTITRTNDTQVDWKSYCASLLRNAAAVACTETCEWEGSVLEREREGEGGGEGEREERERVRHSQYLSNEKLSKRVTHARAVCQPLVSRDAPFVITPEVVSRIACVACYVVVCYIKSVQFRISNSKTPPPVTPSLFSVIGTNG